MDEKADKAYARLRKVRPSGIVAVVGDERRELAIQPGRSKWERVLASAAALGADDLELLDDEGAVVEVVVLRDKPTALHSYIPESEDPEVQKVATLVSIALEASDRAVGRQEAHVAQVLDAAISVMRVAAERAERLERVLMRVIEANEMRLAQDPQAEGGEGDSQGNMLAMLAIAAIGGGGSLPPELMARLMPDAPAAPSSAANGEDKDPA